MSPAFLDQMSWAMAEVYGSVTDRLLTNIARHFKYAQGPQDLKGSFEYQVRKLAELGQVNRENVEIIVSSLDGADAALRMSLELAIRDALKTVDPTLRKAAERGLLQGAGSTPPAVSPGQMQAFKAYYAQSADKLNLVNTVMLESSEDAYRACLSDVVSRIQRTQSILNVGAGDAITGVSSWNKAMHDAVDKMVQNGLTGFIDHAGRHWSPEAYVAMDIRTTLFNTSRAAVWERSEEYGSDIYQVSTHNGARPKCYPWQEKLISRMDNSRDVPDLDGTMVHVYAQSETSYGAPDGLFGVNCKHYPTPFIPGFSTLRGTPQSPEENAKTYEESQEQRALERKVREEKLKLSVMEAQGADADAIRAQRDNVRAASADVQTFCDETGRTRRRSREYTPVNAKFPPEDSYDPATFRTEQRDAIRQWAKGSRGAQSTQTAQAQNVAQQATQTPQNVVQSEKPKAESEFVTKGLRQSGIKRVPLQTMQDKPSQDQIIAKVGGADQTTGSCSSLAFAYAGNKGGYDVRDFRGGVSCDVFSRAVNVKSVAQFTGVDGVIAVDPNAFKAADSALRAVEYGKEYYFSVAQHAAIIRRTQDAGFEYLELQSSSQNGFHKLTNEVLRWRFGAKRSRSFHGMKVSYSAILMDVEKLDKSADFIEMLEYINTPEDQQKKGVGGGIK